ncbi:hypothetical protein KEM63_04270 [Halopseudomonas nanhaiensis]|uniref:hypothetical protein n=1 Tax=Halopseudomonas nanhaiensis TaxID=2830842 RepID=UPI001CC17318|nr:hypothetical protein [Halopseudomonas nanhaiensis]UAW99195.1 hypothetical protein KEM63_04270 [Halopseudomonas nanhaiensis]
MTIVIYTLLGLSLAGASGWLFKRRSGLSHAAGGAVTASVVVLLIAAVAALLTALVLGIGGDGLKHAQRLFGLAARHLSIPVLGLAACFLMNGWRWKPMVWGQVILGLMGAFELARLLDLSLHYEWLVNGLGLVLLAWACLGVGRARVLIILAIAAVGCLLAAALIADTTPLTALFRPLPTASWLIPGLLATALAVGVLADQAHNKAHSSTNEPDIPPRS